MKLFVWGTGRLAGKVIGRYVLAESVKAFIDNDQNKKEYMGKKVLSPQEAAGIEYDAVVVANLYSREIYNQCAQVGIDLKKVIFLYNNCTLLDMNSDYGFIERVLGVDYAKVVKERYHVVRGVEAYGDLFLEENSVPGLCGGGILRMIMSVSNVLNWLLRRSAKEKHRVRLRNWECFGESLHSI